jgi:hypothetical protein
MDKKDLDQLLNTLGIIALYKSMLPFNLRGWVSALGLHVQERKAGQWSRLQAGGQFRSYLDAWREGESDWQVKAFDSNVWERRFAHVVEPTYNIVDYLGRRAAESGGFSAEHGAILIEAIEHYKSTQQWLWLPGLPADLEEFSRQMAQQEPVKLNQIISHAERIRKDSKHAEDWQFLAMLYDLIGRYKDMENGIKIAYDLVRSDFSSAEWMAWGWRRTMGMLYLAAYCNSMGSQNNIVLGSIPSKVTADRLGYTIEEVRILAEENLKQAYADAKREGSAYMPENPELRQIELAISACRK